MSARKITRTAIAMLAATIVATAFPAGEALAAFLHPEVGTPFGTYSESSRGIAIDEATGNLYVNEEGGFIRVTGPNGGAPVGGAPEQLTGSQTPAAAELHGAPTVDNSCTLQGLSGSACEGSDASNRDIYVPVSSENAVDKFRLKGGAFEYVCQFTGWGGFSGSACLKNEPSVEASPTEVTFNRPEGVAVDTQGNVYIANEGDDPAAVYEFSPSGSQVAKIVTKRAAVATAVAVDASGDVYISVAPAEGPSQLIEMKRIGAGAYEEQASTAASAGALAIDNASGVLYVAQGAIHEYSSKLVYGTSVGGTELGESYAIAYNNTSHHLLAVAKGQVHTFATGAVIPDVALTTPVLASGSTTLNGTVNPDETTITNCELELDSVEYSFITFEPLHKQKLPCSTLPGPGNAPQPVAATFTGLIPNETYTARLTAANASGSNTTLPSSVITTAPVLALVGIPAVASVSRTGVALTGTVNPEHSATTFRFEFGTTASYGQDTPVIGVGSDLLDDAVFQKIEGLQPGTTYHYALVATNPAGSTTSSDGEFTTAAPTPPAISEVAVSGLAPGAATVSGTVAADGLPTTYEIDFGADTSYATRSTGQVAGTSQTVSLSMLYLQPGTTYHYRVVARNEDGEVASADQTLTTPGYTLNIPQVLPFLPTPTLTFPQGSQANTGASSVSAKKAKLKAKSRKQAKSRGKAHKRKQQRHGRDKRGKRK